MTYPSNGDAAHRRVQVWDLPTRIFHWLLVAFVVVAWLTGEGEGQMWVIHRSVGEIIAGMLVFRVVWGFIGGEHAQFSDFIAGPSAVAAHFRDLFSKTPKRHLGHNPLGGLAVFLLLLNIAVVVATGLFSNEEDMAGPFAGLWGLELSEIHEVAFGSLQVLIVIHIFGVVVETWKSKDALVPAMITGFKYRGPGEPALHARRAKLGALIVALLFGAATTAGLMAVPPSKFAVSQNHPEQDEQD